MTVDLRDNSIGDKGAAALFHAAKVCPGLKALRLGGNPCDSRYEHMLNDLFVLSDTQRMIAAEDPTMFVYVNGRGWRYRGRESPTSRRILQEKYLQVLVEGKRGRTLRNTLAAWCTSMKVEATQKAPPLEPAVGQNSPAEKPVENVNSCGNIHVIMS